MTTSLESPSTSKREMIKPPSTIKIIRTVSWFLRLAIVICFAYTIKLDLVGPQVAKNWVTLVFWLMADLLAFLDCVRLWAETTSKYHLLSAAGMTLVFVSCCSKTPLLDKLYLGLPEAGQFLLRFGAYPLATICLCLTLSHKNKAVNILRALVISGTVVTFFWLMGMYCQFDHLDDNLLFYLILGWIVFGVAVFVLMIVTMSLGHFFAPPAPITAYSSRKQKGILASLVTVFLLGIGVVVFQNEVTSTDAPSTVANTSTTTTVSDNAPVVTRTRTTVADPETESFINTTTTATTTTTAAVTEISPTHCQINPNDTACIDYYRQRDIDSQVESDPLFHHIIYTFDWTIDNIYTKAELEADSTFSWTIPGYSLDISQSVDMPALSHAVVVFTDDNTPIEYDYQQIVNLLAKDGYKQTNDYPENNLPDYTIYSNGEQVIGVKQDISPCLSKTRVRSNALNFVPLAQAADAKFSQASQNSAREVETCGHIGVTKIVRIATVAELTQTQNEVIARYQKDNLFADLKALFPSWKLTTWSMKHDWYKKEDTQFLGIFIKRFTNSVAIVSDQDIQFSDSDQDPRKKVQDFLEQKGYYLMSDRGNVIYHLAEPWGIYWYSDGIDVVRLEIFSVHFLDDVDDNTYRISVARIGNVSELRAIEAAQSHAAKVNAVTDLRQFQDEDHCMVISGDDEPQVLTVNGNARYLSHYFKCSANNYFIYYTIDGTGQIQELARGLDDGVIQRDDGTWYQSGPPYGDSCQEIIDNDKLTDQDKQYLLYEYLHCPKTGVVSTL